MPNIQVFEEIDRYHMELVGEKDYFLFRIPYSLVTGKEPAIIPICTHRFGFGLFGVFFTFILESLKREGKKRNILSSKNFTLGMPKPAVEMPGSSTVLDMCYSKRSCFTTTPVLEGTHFRSLSFREKGLLPFTAFIC